MILSLIALWLWQGGYWKIAEYAQIIPNPLASSTGDTMFILPGQPQFFEVPDTTSAENEMEFGAADYANPSDALYSEQSFGPRPDTERSPYAGFVELQIGAAQSDNPNDEYVVIQASQFVSLPIPVSGWTIRSALTGVYATVPLAASPFYQGVVNSVDSIRLSSGDAVLFTSGTSPVGVSFRETTCTGYLSQTQRFVPPLSNACARPATIIPRTAQNEAQYGSSCFDLIERLPQCTFPTIVASNITGACRALLTDTLSYTGCMRSFTTGSVSNMATWRAYQSSAHELWGNARDTLVLFDGQGRIVTTLSY